MRIGKVGYSSINKHNEQKNISNYNPQFSAELPTNPVEYEKGYKYIQEYLDSIFGKGVDQISVNEYIINSYKDNPVFRHVSDVSSLRKKHEQVENKQDLIFEALASEAEKIKAKKTKKAKNSLANALERATDKLQTLIVQIEISQVRLKMILDAQRDGVLFRGDIFERMKVNYHKAATIQRAIEAEEMSAAKRELKTYCYGGGHLN